VIYWYQFAYYTALIVLLPFLAPLVLFKRSFRKGLGERLGIYGLRKIKEKFSGRDTWVHAASVGEVRMLKNIPDFSFAGSIITCTTFTGRETAANLHPDAAAVLMPLDLTILMKRFIRLVRPRKLFILETELWPGMIFTARRLKTTIINGRLSDARFRGYLRWKRCLLKVFRYVDAVYPKNEENMLKFKALGVSERKIRTPADLKYLYEPPEISSEDMRYAPVSHPVTVFGSTHYPEEKIISEVIRKIKIKFPDVTFVIAPRHLGRIEEIERIFKNTGISPLRWSLKKGAFKPSEVIILDVMGELEALYSIADMVFVGGSFSNTGGHNVMEPASVSAPVVIGPSYSNFKEPVNYLKKCGALRVAKSEDDLYNIFNGYLSEPERAKEDGRKNGEAFCNMRKRVRETFTGAYDI